MSEPGAPNLVLAGQTRDVGTGTPDPTALDDGSSPPRLRHVPSQQLAALSAAEYQSVERFRLRHNLAPRVMQPIKSQIWRVAGHRERVLLNLAAQCCKPSEAW